MIDFRAGVARCRRKAEIPSLANGAEGWLWTWLQLVGAKLAPVNDRLWAALVASLRESRATPVSHMAGTGATATLAAHAAALDGALMPRARTLVASFLARAAESDLGDYMQGTAGALMACCEIEGTVPGLVDRRRVLPIVAALEASLRRTLRTADFYLGLSHGVAGQWMALAAAASIFDARIDGTLGNRVLSHLEDEALGGPRGTLVWPARRADHRLSVHGWCHGAPGIALALLIVERTRGSARVGRLLNGALLATACFQTPSDTFCCGTVGRAQILVEAYRHTKRRRWLAAARRVAAKPFDTKPLTGLGFLFGELGRAHLEYRLKAPFALNLLGVAL
jgi:lantibiotic modifying enzyme